MEQYSEKDVEEGKRKIADFLFKTTNIHGRYIIFLAVAGMLMDAWNFAAFSASTFAFKAEFLPSPTAFGIAVAIINAGAAIGAITGGYLTDRLGRRVMFLFNMLLFVIFAALSALSTSVIMFDVFRFILGIALGADVATGFSYVFEFGAKEQRKNYYSIWAYLWSITYVVANIVVLILILAIGPAEIIWRIVVGVSAIFSLIILILRTRVPESALWFIHKGKLKSAKLTIKKAYGVDLVDVPDIEIETKKTSISDMIRVFKIGRNRVFGYAETLNILLSFSFWGFSFYIPLMLSMLKFGKTIQIASFSVLIYLPGIVAAVIAPYIIKRYGDKNLNIISAFLVTLMLILDYFALTGIIPLIYFVPISAAFIFFLFLGPYSYNSIINFGFPSKNRGIINGWNYTISKVIAFTSGILGAYIIGTIGLKANTLLLIIIDLICSIALILVAYDVTKEEPVKLEMGAD